MRMTHKMMFATVSAIALLTACSDSPTAPTAARVASKPSFALGDTPAFRPDPVLGSIVVCKEGTAGGTFNVSRVAINGSTGQVQSGAIATGTCLEVASDLSATDIGSAVTIAEVDAPGVTENGVTACRIITATPDGPTEISDCALVAADRFINSFHGYVITYSNTLDTPPPTGCTYTKGWYQNKNGSKTIIAGVDGRSIADQFAIFSATPGKPGGVTWNGGNNVLNLYQQLLASLNNLGNLGVAPFGGPDAVNSAIADALAGTDGTGQAITTTLTQTEVSALINTLSSFNEGTFTGWPHCD